MNSLFLLFIISCASCFMTYLLRRYALARNIIDIPNSRSSHAIPTPRGGGVAIVVIFIISLLALLFLDRSENASIIALLGAGSLVAIVGFLDDHGHIAARWRLISHFSAATWIVFWLSEMPELMFPGFSISNKWLLYPLAILFLVWMLNLYNFMDGIDGIASIEAITTCLGIGLIFYIQGNIEHASLTLILAAAVTGFLIWNFPPARIFMGDAGSGFLGIIIGALALTTTQQTPHIFWSWLILLGVFIVDATWTLLHRLARGEKVYEAHRSHAYQYASRKYGAHLPITMTVLLINTLWLLPWALLVSLEWVNGLWGLLLAYIPLFFLAKKFKAGAREQTT